MDTKDKVDIQESSSSKSDEVKQDKQGKTKPDKRIRRIKRLIRTAIALIILIILYLIVAYSSIPFIKKYRTLYIETAMSTNSHQWLATCFFPKSVVDKVVKNKEKAMKEQEELETKWETEQTEETETITPEEQFFLTYWEIDTPSVRNYLNSNPYLTRNDYSEILVEDFDEELGLLTTNGDPVLVIDVPNNFLLVGKHGTNYVGTNYEGKLAIIKDPSQVELAKSSTFGKRGEEVHTFGERYDAVIAINASGFTDVGGHGSGSDVKGSMIINGIEYGTKSPSSWKFYGMKFDNKFYVSNYSDIVSSQYRWGVEFFPALIVNGECVVDGTLGMGLQPRSAIGQAEDGTFLMLIVDGRQPGYSIGASVQDCSDVLMAYGACQAGNLDGGSSSVMWYKGQQITKSSSVSGRGRYMPNALIVKKAGE